MADTHTLRMTLSETNTSNERGIMGTGRTFNKAPRVRPKKKPRERRRREKLQKQRLVALGAAEETVGSLTTKEIRQALGRPSKVAPPGN